MSRAISTTATPAAIATIRRVDAGFTGGAAPTSTCGWCAGAVDVPFDAEWIGRSEELMDHRPGCGPGTA